MGIIGTRIVSEIGKQMKRSLKSECNDNEACGASVGLLDESSCVNFQIAVDGDPLSLN